MALISLLKIGFLAFYAALGCTREAAWRERQSAHELAELSENLQRDLCQLTNYTEISDHFSHIAVERRVGTTEHENVARYISNKLFDLGYTVEYDTFSSDTPLGVKEFKNIIATEDDGERAHRRLSLACHYESKIFDFEFIGATDAALSCALLLDVAHTLKRLMAARKNREISLQLIFFDGEEAFVRWSEDDSLYGSKHLANLWQNTPYYSEENGEIFENSQLDRMDLLILLDLLGARSPRIPNVRRNGATDLFRSLSEIEEKLVRLDCLSTSLRIFLPYIRDLYIPDDHIPFILRGKKALHLIPYPFPRIWHRAGDTGNALDSDSIRALSSILRIFVAKYLGVETIENVE